MPFLITMMEERCMNSKAAYTTKWLNRNKQYWYEKTIDRDVTIIVIKKKDAPKIVKQRVLEINLKRCGFKCSLAKKYKGEDIESAIFFGRPLLSYKTAVWGEIVPIGVKD